VLSFEKRVSIMSSDIVLSPGVRQNLLALQNTAGLLSVTQNRLATGKKVNTALDNPVSYFTSQALSQRVGDLNSLLDSIGQAQQTLKAADAGITSLTSLVQSAKSIATQALQTAKGAVNYTNITGTAAIPADTTKISATSNVASSGVVSSQSTATLDVSALVTAGAAANGQTLSLSLNGITKTYTFNNAAGNGTTVFSTGAELQAEVLADFQTTGAVATVGGVAANAFTATSIDAVNSFTIGGTATTGTGTQVTGTSTAAAVTGDALTISDGTHTQTFYRVAAGASIAGHTFSTAANLKTAIDATNLVTGGSPVTTTVNGTGVDIKRADGGDVTISGALGVADGYISNAAGTTFNSNFNATLAPLSGSLTIGVGTNAVHTLSFGTGIGQIFTRTALNTALAAFTDVAGSVNTTGHVNLAPSSSDNVTVGGTGAILTALGLTAGTTTPSATVITPNAARSSLQNDFNNLLSQIDQLAKDASYSGVNLLYGDSLKVVFNPDGTSSLNIAGVKFDAAGLGLTAISGTGFQDNKVVSDTLAKIGTTLDTLRTQASRFGTSVGVVQVRQDFTKNLINTLQIGSDNLVLADTNEEGANLLALQTRQQLSTTALSLANQASQAVLRLFG
jgi:flagellin